MIRSRAAGALLLLSVLCSLAACDNPTDVGGELVPGEGAGPQRVVLKPGAGLDVDTTRYAPETGTSLPGEIDVARFLAGRQEAVPPSFGKAEATGYIDVERASAPSDLEGRDIDSVNVELVADYAYGDTTRPTRLSLHDLTEEWDVGNTRADTSFAPGFAENAPITTFTAARGDTLTVPLPRDWIRDHAGELNTPGDTAFAEAFHGFQVRAAGETGVVGFTSSAARMRVFYEPPADEQAATAVYSLTEQLTTVRSSGRASDGDESDGDDRRTLIQDGTGRVLSFELDPPDSLRSVAVNNAALILEADTTLETLPEGFRRPQLRRLELRDAPPGDENDRLPGGLFLDFNAASGRFENSFALRDLVQDVLNGTVDYGEIQVRAPRRLVSVPRVGNLPVPVPSLNSALICRDASDDAGAGDGACSGPPRLELLYTPLEDE